MKTRQYSLSFKHDRSTQSRNGVKTYQERKISQDIKNVQRWSKAVTDTPIKSVRRSDNSPWIHVHSEPKPSHEVTYQPTQRSIEQPKKIKTDHPRIMTFDERAKVITSKTPKGRIIHRKINKTVKVSYK